MPSQQTPTKSAANKPTMFPNPKSEQAGLKRAYNEAYRYVLTMEKTGTDGNQEFTGADGVRVSYSGSNGERWEVIA